MVNSSWNFNKNGNLFFVDLSEEAALILKSVLEFGLSSFNFLLKSDKEFIEKFRIGLKEFIHRNK